MSDGPKPEAPSGGQKRQPTLGDFFFIGTACAVSILVAGGAGYLLDSWLGTTPWLTFAGLAFGITSAVLLSYNNFRKFV